MEDLAPLIKIALAAIVMAAIVFVVYGWLAEVGNTSGVAKPRETPIIRGESIFPPPKKQSW